MTEHMTGGAHGAPPAVDLAAYKHAIQEAPVLLEHLAALVTPGALLDTQVRSTELARAPGRVAPLDEAEAVYSWLWREAGAWIGQSALEVAPIGHMVRRDDKGRVIGSRWIISDDTGATRMVRDARVLVGIILKAWPTIEAWAALPQRGSRVATSEWMADVDEALLGPLRRWPRESRGPVPEKPRQCPVCGHDAVFTGLVTVSTGTAVCARCEQVVEGEAWMTYEHAAQQLGVAVRTIQRFAEAGVPTRRKHGTLRREIELGAARMERDMREARRALNLPQMSPPPC